MAVQSFEVQALPRDVVQFVDLRDELVQVPAGGAVMMVLALLLYAQAPKSALGKSCLTIAVDRSRISQDRDGYKGWSLNLADLRLIHSQLNGRGYIARSYFHGTALENAYALPTAPYNFIISDNPYSGDMKSGTYKVFVLSSGAATPRPVTLRRNSRGLWKALEWSSLITGVRPPAADVDDDL